MIGRGGNCTLFPAYSALSQQCETRLAAPPPPPSSVLVTAATIPCCTLLVGSPQSPTAINVLILNIFSPIPERPSPYRSPTRRQLDNLGEPLRPRLHHRISLEPNFLCAAGFSLSNRQDDVLFGAPPYNPHIRVRTMRFMDQLPCRAIAHRSRNAQLHSCACH
jgi:hypothetical protein